MSPPHPWHIAQKYEPGQHMLFQTATPLHYPSLHIGNIVHLISAKLLVQHPACKISNVSAASRRCMLHNVQTAATHVGKRSDVQLMRDLQANLDDHAV